MSIILFLIVGFLSQSVTAQDKKPYFIRVTIDQLKLGADSVIFKAPKTFYIETTGKTDTLEVGSVKGTPIGMVVEVRKIMSGNKVRTQIGYAFYQRANSGWKLIRHFGYVTRPSLVKKPDEIKKSKSPKAAKEEFFCSIGDPLVFSAAFRMDVYLNE